MERLKESEEAKRRNLAKKHAAELAAVKEAEETERAQREAQFRDGRGQFRIDFHAACNLM